MKARQILRTAALIWVGFGLGGIILTAQGIVEQLSHSPVTDYCPICQLVTIDGVVLVDTQTGTTNYVDVWTPHRTLVGEVAPWEQQLEGGDHCTFQFMGGGLGARYNHMGGCSIEFTPHDTGTTAYLCETHSGWAGTDYVLVDTKQTPHIAYPVIDGAKYEIRHMSVIISNDGGDEYCIDIESNLYADEIKALEELG